MTVLLKKGSPSQIISLTEKKQLLLETLKEIGKHRKVLLVPPDYTRIHSKGGEITRFLFDYFKSSDRIDILPAVGTHSQLTEKQRKLMFGAIPPDHFIQHNWRKNVSKIGKIPSEFIKEISKGKIEYSINVEVNRLISENKYDIIFSIGQVVPHEVTGMANGNKNIIVGLGGVDIINKSHFLGASLGIENLLGKIHTPVRDVFNYVEENFLSNLKVIYILTVVNKDKSGKMVLQGLFVGEHRDPFELAAKLSQQVNINYLSKPVEKFIVYLNPEEFKSTWLGNKAIYRTRMALADRGELLVIAPGLKSFGEDPLNDQLIRKYGYKTTDEILEEVENNPDLKENLSVAAHLMHGSSENRFKVTYSPGYLTKKEILKVNYRYADLSEILRKYDPKKLRDGYNKLQNNEDIFFISNPGIGLWKLQERVNNGKL
ncbi:MAG: lactate racemase domain-containing protein [Candidatus Hodarchaeales archaeon]